MDQPNLSESSPYDKDFRYVATLLTCGRLKDAKIHLGLVTQSIIASNQGQSLDFPGKLAISRLLNEIRAVELLAKAHQENPKKFQFWLTKAKDVSMEHGERLLEKIEDLAS